MKVEWNGERLCDVTQDDTKYMEGTQDGKGWIVSTIPHPKYGSKSVWCNDIQMLTLVRKFKAWAVAKEDRQGGGDHSRVTHVKVVGGTKYYYYGDDEGGE